MVVQRRPVVITAVVLLSTLILAHTCAAVRVAVVGAGIAGASAAYHLRKLNVTDIHVYEAERVGGRAREVFYHGQALELGASIVWENNYLLRNISHDLGLAIKWLSPPTDTSGEVDADADDAGPFALWDGHAFVANQSANSLITAVRFAWRYGLAPLVYGRHATQVWRDAFRPVYPAQDNGVSWDRVDTMLQDLGLWPYTQAACRQYMEGALSSWWLQWGVSAFVEELAGAINRCNYNQASTHMNALAGLVSYLPAAGGGVWAVKGGNSQMASRMLAASGAVHITARVARISRVAHGGYHVLTDVPGDDGGSRMYDAVVVAAPLELSGIQVEGRDPPATPDSTCKAGNRQFQTTVTTYVVGGELQPAAFGVSRLPGHTVLVTESADSDFSAISSRMVTPDGGQPERVYKLFSPALLSDARIAELFGPNATILAVKEWQAYPRFAPPEEFSPFHLLPGVCYTSALENAASAMEVAALAGRNCALLTHQHLAQQADDVGAVPALTLGTGDSMGGVSEQVES